MILVVSYPGEEHTVDVVKRLENQGREVCMLDLADFPNRFLTLSWPDSNEASYVVDYQDGPVNLQNASVGWWRRVRPFDVDERIVTASTRAFAESETSQAVNGMLDALPCEWVNHRSADDTAQHKPYQWATANEVGLSLPKTLVTNNPDQARTFIEANGIGNVVFKAFLASYEAWRETRLIETEDMEKLDSVRYAPVIFQEYIRGVDLRITIIGDKLFPAEIDAGQTSYPVDMRMVIGETEVKPVKLPIRLEKALLKLQRRLGLSYGAIDMRRTPDDEYIFFEVNPAGQWLFVEERTGLPISQAMADYLAKSEDFRKKNR